MTGKQYRQLESNAERWLEKAEGLMLSAEVVWDKITPLWRLFFSDNRNVRAILKQFVGYSNSCFLLTAYAFENLYRGTLIACGKSWRDALKGRESHSLFKHLSGITDLTEEEGNFVKRLETFLLW